MTLPQVLSSFEFALLPLNDSHRSDHYHVAPYVQKVRFRPLFGPSRLPDFIGKTLRHHLS